MLYFDRFVRSAWAWAALIAIVVAASFPGLMSIPPLDRDESRFAQASAQMLETGDYVVIRYHDELRNKKPVGIHWLQTAAVSLASSAEARDIAAYRLPSLLGAIGAVLATMWGGLALFGRRAAFLGAAILGGTLLLTSEAHIAKTDAALVCSIAVAMACLAHLRKGGDRWLGVVFWVAMGAGVLIKAVIAPMVVGLAILALGLIERRWAWMRHLLFWPGLSLFAIISIPWFIAVEIATGGAFLREAAGVDLAQKVVGAAEGHKGPIGMHLAALPLLFWPGSLLLIPGLWMAIRAMIRHKPFGARTSGGRPAKGTALQAVKKTDDKASLEAARQAANQDHAANEAADWLFLLCWAVPCWIVFELAPTKLVHYTLPAYPALALMAGAAADRWLSGEGWKGVRWIGLAVFAAIGAVLLLATTPPALAAFRADAVGQYPELLRERIGFEWAQAWRETGVGYWAALVIALAVGGTAYAVVRKHALGVIGGLLACSLVLGYVYRAVVLPNQSWMLSTEAAVDALREVCALPEGTAVARTQTCRDRPPRSVSAIAFAEPSFVFELADKVTLPPKSSAAIPPSTVDPRPAWLINIEEDAGRAALASIIDQAAAADRCVRLARRYAYNYSNGDPSILVAAVVEPGGCPTFDGEPENPDLGEFDKPPPDLEL
ncbi:MAG: glycosyltransferase family 39 protein [Hyphomonadaceae bacterium]